MLENDLVLTRYLDACGTSFTEADAASLNRLLDLSDNELWELLSGRLEPADAADAPFVERLRAT
jgi:antitoxin CptB